MFDEMQRLRASASLLQLLTHYATGAGPDPQAWQDRVMALDGTELRELAQLHGELIAFGWVEQNTGMTPVLKPGVAAACYRVTAAGRRALRRVERDEEEDELPQAA